MTKTGKIHFSTAGFVCRKTLKSCSWRNRVRFRCKCVWEDQWDAPLIFHHSVVHFWDLVFLWFIFVLAQLVDTNAFHVRRAYYTKPLSFFESYAIAALSLSLKLVTTGIAKTAVHTRPSFLTRNKTIKEVRSSIHWRTPNDSGRGQLFSRQQTFQFPTSSREARPKGALVGFWRIRASWSCGNSVAKCSARFQDLYL